MLANLLSLEHFIKVCIEFWVWEMGKSRRYKNSALCLHELCCFQNKWSNHLFCFPQENIPWHTPPISWWDEYIQKKGQASESYYHWWNINGGQPDAKLYRHIFAAADWNKNTFWWFKVFPKMATSTKGYAVTRLNMKWFRHNCASFRKIYYCILLKMCIL